MPLWALALGLKKKALHGDGVMFARAKVNVISSPQVCILRFYGPINTLRSCQAGQLTYPHCFLGFLSG